MRGRRTRGDMFEMLEPKFLKEATSWNLPILQDQARIAMVKSLKTLLRFLEGRGSQSFFHRKSLDQKRIFTRFSFHYKFYFYASYELDST